MLAKAQKATPAMAVVVSTRTATAAKILVAMGRLVNQRIMGLPRQGRHRDRTDKLTGCDLSCLCDNELNLPLGNNRMMPSIGGWCANGLVIQNRVKFVSIGRSHVGERRFTTAFCRDRRHAARSAIEKPMRVARNNLQS